MLTDRWLNADPRLQDLGNSTRVTAMVSTQGASTQAHTLSIYLLCLLPLIKKYVTTYVSIIKLLP